MATNQTIKNKFVELILFRLNEETFSFKLMNIKEIIEKVEIINVPKSDDYIAGIINLRGEIITIYNLKKKIGIVPSDIVENSMVIIVEYQKFKIGVLVDSVEEVTSIPVSHIEDVPTQIAGISADYLEGVGRVEDKPILILNINKIVDLE